MVTGRRLQTTWIVLLGLSQAADLLTTWFSLNAGFREQNPFVAATLHRGDFLLYAVVKVALVAAMALAVQPGGRRVAWIGLRAVVVVFSLVAAGNLVASFAG